MHSLQQVTFNLSKKKKSWIENQETENSFSNKDKSLAQFLNLSQYSNPGPSD